MRDIEECKAKFTPFIPGVGTVYVPVERVIEFCEKQRRLGDDAGALSRCIDALRKELF